jgi:predicted MPP superfamily phosphohydrolase
MTPPRRLLILLAVVAVIAASMVALGYREATSMPITRRASVGLADWPRAAPPLRVILLADIHVAGPDMPPARLATIVAQVNYFRPDIVLIAGDFIGDKDVGTRRYSLPEAVAPLRGLRSRLGTFAVLGNHDHWRNAGETRAALTALGVRVLDNDAVQAGPLAIGGVDDAFTQHADLASTVAAMRALPGAKVLLSHSPDPFPDLPRDIPLMLAGHTHCGQIVLPLVGPLVTMSAYGRRYACGRVDEGGKTLFVSAGLGTSVLPLRLGAPPDLWLLELGPKPNAAR